ncbi:MAG TPA: hypothetical protein VI636_21610 [Candidatus Angelobacter sp.]
MPAANWKTLVLTGLMPLISFTALLFPSVVSHAQTLEHVRMFWDFTPDVQFLPGGYIIEGDDGKAIKTYIYKRRLP